MQYRDIAVRFEDTQKRSTLLIIATRFTTMLKHPIREDAPPSKRLKPINAPTTKAKLSASSAEGSTYITSSSAGGLCTTTTTSTTTNHSSGGAALVRPADGAASSPSSSSYRDPPESATDNQVDKENEKMIVFLCGRASIPYQPQRSSSATTTTSPTTNKKTRIKAFKFPMKVRNTICFAASSTCKISKTDPLFVSFSTFSSVESSMTQCLGPRMARPFKY